MATNDGYSPYPIGLTAAEATGAIRRAFNLSTELLGYVRFKSHAERPNALATKDGDLWYNSTGQKLYRASVDSGTVVWFEV
jgi:hypothetical protein